VLPTDRLFGRVTQKGPNKTSSGQTKLRPNFVRFCTERAEKGLKFLKFSFSPLILSDFVLLMPSAAKFFHRTGRKAESFARVGNTVSNPDAKH
jgi:hypothetical protein